MRFRGLVLVWPAATDDVSVVAYDVFQDDMLLGRIEGANTQYVVTQLTPWTEYSFQ